MWFAAVGIVILAFWVVKSWRLTPEPDTPGRLQQILEEVAPVDDWIGSLTADASGSTLAYIKGTKAGRRIVLLDLKTLDQRQIPTTNEVSYLFGWSPDGHYLALTQTPPSPQIRHKTTSDFVEATRPFVESWLTLYDRDTGSIRRLTKDTNVMELPFCWLPNGYYLMNHRNRTNYPGDMLLGNPGSTNREKVSRFEPGFLIISDRLGAFGDVNLFTLELKPLARTKNGWDETSRTVQKISDFSANGFSELMWIRYCAANSNFLFRSHPAGANWHFLYKYNPATWVLTQLSHEDTYNGQWLQNGSGFAYIINSNNSFHLVIRTKERRDWTNLFSDGNVASYTTSPTGDRLYITASQGFEPRAIWEYTITNRALRKIAEGWNRFKVAEIVQPREFTLTSYDGLKVPCFLFAPAALSANSENAQSAIPHFFLPKRKYPLVIYLPPPSAQFQRGFEYQSQTFANMGFYFAAINYRGCDGYGAEYAQLANPANAARDVLRLYQALMKNPNIDAKNVFLLTSSGGMAVVTELLASKPKLWRAVGLDKPSGCAVDERFDPGKLPPMIIIMGNQDPALDSMENFAAWARTNGVQVESVIHRNTGHIIYSEKDRQDTLQHLVEFFDANRAN